MRNINIAYGIVFLLFIASYLLFFQKDMLLYMVSYLGFTIDDKTFYIAVSLILLLLSLITFMVKKGLGTGGIISSLCCFPSLFIMGVVTSVDSSSLDGNLLDYKWLWLTPVIIISYILLITLLKRIFYYDMSRERDYLKIATWNFTLLFIQFIITLFIGNTSASFHRDLSAERRQRDNQSEKVVIVDVDSTAIFTEMPQ